ncbi:MAG TPA: hypothetical protein PKL49_03035 [Steroidobacteraceae bacterium]|nr:hypothetical protein [Steroidobacteraceae bacterium]HNS28193.1 hypothetical protein [Steroidobacteraceae bacterium]
MITPSPAEVLSALAKGFDPSSGELLDATGIWQQPAITDALRAGAAALGEEAASAPATAQPRPTAPANVGQPWTPQEEQELLASFAAGTPLPEIAARHLRSLTAIEARLERLGKITPEQRVTRNRFTATRAPAE